MMARNVRKGPPGWSRTASLLPRGEPEAGQAKGLFQWPCPLLWCSLPSSGSASSPLLKEESSTCYEFLTGSRDDRQGSWVIGDNGGTIRTSLESLYLTGGTHLPTQQHHWGRAFKRMASLSLDNRIQLVWVG